MKNSLLKTISTFSIIYLFLISCENTEVPVSEVNLDASFLIIEVDSTATLVADIEPLDASNKTLNWNSSDSTIAKVNSDGIVTGISPGTAQIIVKSNNGQLEKCEVNIIKIIEYEPIEQINFGSSPFLAFDNNDNLWYAGFGGIYKMGFDDFGWKFHPMNTEVMAFDFDSKNNLWAATTDMGLLKFDGQAWSAYDTLNSELPTNSIYSICVDNNDIIWVGFGGNKYYPYKVGRFDGNQWKVFDSDECLINEWSVYSIKADKQNNIWFAHHTDVSMYDGSSWKLIIDDNEFGSLNILDIEEDNEKSIWFTSTFNGVFKYNGTNIINYNTNNSPFSSDYFQSVGIDDKGNKWLGNKSGIIKYNDKEWLPITYPNFNISDIRNIAIDSEGNKWLASPSRLYHLID
jgi:ligand-binding sensor domain-containing protein